MGEETKALICGLCNKEFEYANVNFSYLGHDFHANVLQCPLCGQVYVSEEMAKGRMAQVEMMLEDK